MLDLTTAEVSGVATFYTQYKRHPNGDYTVGVCINTLCAVMGGDAIFDELSGLPRRRARRDHRGRQGHPRAVECNAACDFAPVVMVNWEFFDNQTPGTARALVDDLRSGKDVVPTRGAATVCSFKAVSRVLAGFSDGRAGEGVGAAGPTLEGLEVAHREGWTAPRLHGDGATATGSGASPDVESIAHEHVTNPGAPSAHDAGAAGQTGRAPATPRKRTTKRAPRKDG